MQELSVDMLLSVLKSCRNVTVSDTARSNTLIDNLQNDSAEHNQIGLESRRSQAEKSMRSTRGSARSLRASLVKGTSGGGNGVRVGKKRRDRAAKSGEGPPSEGTAITGASSHMLLCRLPDSFISKAEKFFLEEASSGITEV